MVKSSRRGLSCPVSVEDGTAFLNLGSPGIELAPGADAIATCDSRIFRGCTRPGRNATASPIWTADGGTVLADACRPFGAPSSRARRNAA